MKLITGNGSKKLGEAIASELGLALTKSDVRRFSDMEVFAEIYENVRGNDVFIIQSTSYPANDNIMELLIMIDAIRRASASRITAVIPYFGYARQDRKTGSRTPITAKLVANMITNAGAHRVMTMDLHAGQIQGFFDIPTDNLFAIPLLAREMEKVKAAQVSIVSPDVGGVVRARAVAARLGADLVIIDKRRQAAGQSEVMHIIGEVKDKTCILVDDIVDSAGTLCNAADSLKQAGATDIYAFITHGVLSGEAHKKIAQSQLKELVITDTIQPTPQTLENKKIRIISVAPLMAEAIRRTHIGESVSSLFDG